MGANESSLALSDDAPSDPHQNDRFLFKLYSKQFEPDVELETGEKVNLYLDDYGDEEDDEPQQTAGVIETPTVAAAEDLDYPIESMHANLDTVPPSNHSADEKDENKKEMEENSIEAGIIKSFEESRQQNQSELNERYPSLQSRTSPCENEREALMQCYKSNDDILNCRKAVDRYSVCAKNASYEATQRRS